MEKTKVTIITVNYNQAETTFALLDSLRRQDYENLEVIVVDNASREDPLPALAQRYPEVIALRSARNLGFAGGNNLALPHATGQYLFFINNDTEVPTGCIRTLVDFMHGHPQTGLLSPLILYHPETAGRDNLIQYAGMTPVSTLTGRNRTVGEKQPDEGQFAAPTRTAYAHGAAMLMPRTVLDAVGPMFSDFFLYYEELDWGERVRRAGYEIWVEPRARIFHKESLTVGKMGGLKTYFLNRNRVLFMRRNHRGLRHLLFLAYWWLVVTPKTILQSALRRDTENLNAFLLSLWWQINPRSINRYEAIGKQSADPSSSVATMPPQPATILHK
ncbi:MAG: glycosyltransferase family 2 protein [Saprospiraceae bacterium]|nr:glycosyltransferase family 2 protein [Saprospiraceae bacterium]